MSKPLTPTDIVLAYVARFQLIDARQELRKAKAAGRVTPALAARFAKFAAQVDAYDALEREADPGRGIFY